MDPRRLNDCFGTQFISAFYLSAPPCIGWASPFSLFGYPLDCNKYTDSNVVLAELGQIPMRIKMVRRQCNYWNRLVDLDDNSLLHKATKEQLFWIKNMSNKDRRCWINVTSEALKTYKINIIIEEKPIYVPIHILQALPDIHEDEIFYTKTMNNNQDNRDLYSSQLFNRVESYRSRTYAQWFWRSGYPLGITKSENMKH